MPRRSPVLLLGAVLTIALAAEAAAAPTVSLRVEGADHTLISRTTVTTNTAPVVKDGTDAHSCTGDSAAGALELASGGAWDGPWYDGLGYSVESVKGEGHSFGSGSFWGVFLNGYVAQTGICGITLQQGDSLVLAPVGETATTNRMLELSGVPATAVPGEPVTVTVKALATTVEPPDYLAVQSEDPADGASLTGSAATATTGADGKATLTFTERGPATVRATRAGDVRSATESVCVTDGTDGYCGTIAPGQTKSTTAPPAAAAPAAVADHDVPFGSVASIPEQQHYKRGKAPRQLGGAVDGEPSGIKDIRLRLTRRAGKRCERLDPARERWVKAAKCGADNSPFFSIGDRTPWSYLLPQALTRGRYVLDVQVADRAGNVRRGNTRGGVREQRNRVVFFVD
jgi:hypothetical protein